MALQSLKDQSHVEKTRSFVKEQQSQFIGNVKTPQSLTFFKTNLCYIPFTFTTKKNSLEIQKVKRELKKKHDFRFWYMPNSNRYESYISVQGIAEMNKSWNRIRVAIDKYNLIT
jgi:hypothetical protein